MPFFNSLLSWIIKKRIHQIELFIKHPHDVQYELFRNLIHAAQSTEFGKKYDFKSIINIDQFRERVPIQSYEQFKPYVDRLMKGEQNLLWPGDVKWFAKSSGTTSAKSKFIPVSQETLEACHYKGGKDLLSIYVNNRPESMLFDGRLLSLGGSQAVNSINNSSYYGDLSAILTSNLPFWIQILRTPQLSIALMDEWEEKIEKMATATMKKDVACLAGVPSWMLVFIDKVLELSGKDYLKEVWPKLELIVHGGVNFTPYRERFSKLIPQPEVYYMETYNASEGFFGIQDSFDRDDMLLMLDYGIYYEFLPINPDGTPAKNSVLLDEVETGKRYALVITTNSGLWRYMIGDTIVFTSTSPYRIKVVGRTTLFMNAFGEEVIIDNTDKAIAHACKESNCEVSEYTAAPVYFSNDSNGAHEWLIEFEKKPKNITEFAGALDKELKKLNSDYEAKRYKDMTLGPPIIKILPDKTFYKWLKSKDKLGGQHKIPRLSNDRKILEDILRFKDTV